jgi:excisionase family DNA binding protein
MALNAAGMPKLMVLKDACKYGGFQRTKAYHLIRAGKIDAYRMGRKVMIDRGSIDAYHRSLPKVTPDDTGAPA